MATRLERRACFSAPSVRAADYLSRSSLAPNYLLANAERDGEKYAGFAGRNLARGNCAGYRRGALLGGGNAGGVTQPGHRTLCASPLHPTKHSPQGSRMMSRCLMGSNAEEARVARRRNPGEGSHVRLPTLERSFGALPPQIVAAYPHGTDEEARQARLDLERDLRFGWDMWAWARLQVRTGHNRIYYYSFRQRPPFPVGSVYEGWGASHFAELWYVFDHLDQAPWPWSPADLKLAARMSGYWT